MRRTLAGAAQALAAGEITSRELVEACLERAMDPAGEGARAFTRIDAQQARATADAIDRMRKAGTQPGRFAGVPIAVKDLFDVAGQPTTAGSRVLADRPPAECDAAAIARLRACGFVIVGRNNMTEFAYSGLGMNHHFGTPANPWRRDERRIPGGSSSGAAVAVADAMAVSALGTDTGGSCRIPAALSGVTGFKPTAARVPRDGVVPLSTSLDSVGPLAASVSCCAILDSIVAGEPIEEPAALAVAGLRVGLVGRYAMNGIDDTVAAAWERSLGRLSAAGARIMEIGLDVLDEIPRINARGGLVGAEAYAWHRTLLESKSHLYDPWVLQRFEAGRSQSAADYIDTIESRRRIQQAVRSRTAAVDVLLAPTVPIVAPRCAELADVEAANRTNLFLLRNPALVNFLDGCAISLPCHLPGEAPVGLMLIAGTGEDRRLLAIASAVESLLAGRSSRPQ
ncbi:MAG: amidase [Hyphomicrobiales bacterium]|nr:amidase [Hyphomicrobiales bacterium]